MTIRKRQYFASSVNLALGTIRHRQRRNGHVAREGKRMCSRELLSGTGQRLFIVDQCHAASWRCHQHESIQKKSLFPGTDRNHRDNQGGKCLYNPCQQNMASLRIYTCILPFPRAIQIVGSGENNGFLLSRVQGPLTKESVWRHACGKGKKSVRSRETSTLG